MSCWINTQLHCETLLKIILLFGVLPFVSCQIKFTCIYPKHPFFVRFTVDLQFCDNFCHTAKWFSYACTHIHSLRFFSHINYHRIWVVFSVPYSRSPLANYPIHFTVHMQMPNPQSILPCPTCLLWWSYVCQSHKFANNKCWWGWRANGTLLHLWWKCKLVKPLWETHRVSSKN